MKGHVVNVTRAAFIWSIFVMPLDNIWRDTLLCLRIVTGTPWDTGNMPIHEDFGVSVFAKHIKAITKSFDSKLASVENPLVRQILMLTEG